MNYDFIQKKDLIDINKNNDIVSKKDLSLKELNYEDDEISEKGESIEKKKKMKILSRVLGMYNN